VELDRDDGMPTTFVVSLDNVTPVRPALLTELSAKRMQAVCDALGHATACQ